jgi:hypothetical protein
MRNDAVLESWEFGDPLEVVARREARDRNKDAARRRGIELRMNRRRIRALVACAIRKARSA